MRCDILLNSFADERLYRETDRYLLLSKYSMPRCQYVLMSVLHSITILKYLADKYGKYYPSDRVERAKVYMVVDLSELH